MTHHEADDRGVTDYGDTEVFHTELTLFFCSVTGKKNTHLDNTFILLCHGFEVKKQNMSAEVEQNLIKR